MAAHTRRILLASASTIAICYTILRMLRALKKPRKLLRGPEEIGTVVGESELQDASAPEYDIVIIGGGKLIWSAVRASVTLIFCSLVSLR